MDNVFDKIFIGNSSDAKMLDPWVKSILNVAADLPSPRYPKRIVSAKVGLHDRLSEDESAEPCNDDTAYILAAKTLRHFQTHTRGHVLVHCHSGISRSTAVVALFLTHYIHFELVEALDHIRKLRRAAFFLHKKRWPLATMPHVSHVSALRRIIDVKQYPEAAWL